jgi:hypothetical protein
MANRDMKWFTAYTQAVDLLLTNDPNARARGQESLIAYAHAIADGALRGPLEEKKETDNG